MERNLTYAQQVRNVIIQLRDLGYSEIRQKDLFEPLDLVTNEDKKPLRTTLHEFIKTGEIETIRPNVYVYKGKPGTQEIRSAMWAVLRMRKIVTIDDLQELCGASRDYANEFIRLLLSREVVEKIPCHPTGGYFFRLVNDTGPQPPEDSEKAARLRKIRAAKKVALELIEAAGSDLIAASQKLFSARLAVNDLPEEVPDGDE